MLRSESNVQNSYELVCIEDLVPQDHQLRKIQKYIDFSFILEKVKPFYCEDNGRPSIDPVRLFKMMFIGYLYGIRSERQLEKEVQVNNAYRWFLGLGFQDRVPDHSTISLNRQRFRESNVFQDIFDHIVFQAISHRMVGGRVLITDSTHLKANANKKKFVKQEIAQSTKNYIEQLDEAVRLDREVQGKKF
jgi:transposase